MCIIMCDIFHEKQNLIPGEGEILNKGIPTRQRHAPRQHFHFQAGIEILNNNPYTDTVLSAQ
jgi:hypothetical protein